MKDKIDQNAIRLEYLIKVRFCLVDEVNVFKQEGRNNALAFKSCITPLRPKVKE